MNENLVVRYGDLNLKGKNKIYFFKMANSLIIEKLSDLNVDIKPSAERVYINLKDESLDIVLDRLNHVSGLYSYSLYTKCERDINAICKLALESFDKYHKENESFKVEARRTYKAFELNSLEIMKEVSSFILKNRGNIKVDVHNPDFTINIDIRDDGAYVLTDTFKGLGGYPTGTGGKSLIMMSGGIDSPVAAFELIKQGMTVELIHFESTPMTSIESAQKVIDLSKKICEYTRGSKVILHMVPFTNIHNEILNKVKEEYTITIMRRCMYRIASKIASLRHIIAIGNGESLGQVASQTIESMNVINNVVLIPVLRPLLTIDKKDIIKKAKMIDTYDISIRPFEDCCTVYVPKNPVIKPTIVEAEKEEEKGDFEALIEDAVKHTYRITIKKDTNLDLASYGFTVREALEEYKRGEDK